MVNFTESEISKIIFWFNQVACLGSYCIHDNDPGKNKNERFKFEKSKNNKSN